MGTETDTINCSVVHESEKAYLLSDKDGKEAWFPKSEIYFHMRNTKTGRAVADIPLWLLKAKGWNE